MTAGVFTLRSRNPHATCHLFPCATCRARRDGEQAARDRHPAGKAITDAMPASGWALCVKADGLHVDCGDLDSDQIRAMHDATAEWINAWERGAPDAELAILADSVRDAREPDPLTRGEALRVAMALQNHASRMEQS